MARTHDQERLLGTNETGPQIDAVREALPMFDRRLAGFAMADAVLTGVETRTSSPLRITRIARSPAISPKNARIVIVLFCCVA